MKIILAMVESVDGKTTKWGEPDIHAWTSKEDRAYFSVLIKKSRLVIMGRNTFEVVKQVVKPSPQILKAIMANDLEEYKDLEVKGQLEFINEDPASLVRRLENRGFTEALLVGGSEVNAQFFRENLIDELWLTVEPVVLGSGNGLVSEHKLNVSLVLLSNEKLNERGTILLKYQVIKNR